MMWRINIDINPSLYMAYDWYSTGEHGNEKKNYTHSCPPLEMKATTAPLQSRLFKFPPIESLDATQGWRCGK